MAYKVKAYKAAIHLIDTHPSLDGTQLINWKHPMWSLVMALEHDRIHLETSSVLMRELPLRLLQRPAAMPREHESAFSPKVHPPVAGDDYPVNQMLHVEAGTASIGKPRDFPTYGWDNEYGHRETSVPAFEASKYMITNGEMWEFVSAGGYLDKKYWCESGWSARRYNNQQWPAFWEKDGPAGSYKYKLRTSFDLVNMPWSWPVEVQYYEARAYARWKQEKEGSAVPLTLMSENEHHRLRSKADVGHEMDWVIDNMADRNSNLKHGSPSPVDAYPATPGGFHDVMGNVWEWTEDNFNMLPGFELHPYYMDFSEPCFDGRHNLIMGGSFASTGDLSSRFARFHFRPHFRQHSGFRLVQSTEQDLLARGIIRLDSHGTPITADSSSASLAEGFSSTGSTVGTSKIADDNDSIYETQSSVDQYLLLHYGKEEDTVIPHDNLPVHALNYPRRCADFVHAARPKGVIGGRALDLGCSVGRSTLELARGFDEVVGIDFSQAFVNAAEAVRVSDPKNPLTFSLTSEGSTVLKGFPAVVPPELDADVRAKCSFEVGDACDIRPDIGTFDAVLMANLICRLPRPMSLLERLPSMVNPGGVLVFTTPFSWLEEYTPKENWFGENGEDSFDVLRTHLEKNGFVLEERFPVPLLIREHRRKYQYIVADGTVWRKQ
jgi:5-histidylcysteine sulfoxide synthase/putative 4-mercaptohistidine N1-methyltranferase